MVSLTVAQVLKERTAHLHTSVEASTGLRDPGLTLAGLSRVVALFYGFWGANEPSIDGWASEHPALADELQWARRRRTHLFAEDLGALGRDLPRVGHGGGPAVLLAPCSAQVLGWLYVAEGSTLGGAILDRRLRVLTGAAGLRLRSFSPYAEGPGPMWLSYREVVAEWVRDDRSRSEAVVAAAVHTFNRLDSWLRPIAGGS